MKGKKEVVSIIASLLVFILLIQGAGRLLIPELDVSGTNWKSYRMEPENSVQVLFVGSSVVFCDIAPAVVYKESGITSYLIAGPEQTMPISYYFIREACKTQKPEAVFVELKGLFFAQYGEHTIANLAFLPNSLNRLEAVFRTARREDIPGLLFPVLDYHERWNDLTLAELQERMKPARISENAGYMARNFTNVQDGVQTYRPNGEYAEECARYLRRISSFCEEQGISLYLFFAPVTTTVDSQAKAWVASILPELNISGCYDFSTEEAFTEIGLDMQTDWSDDLHLNVKGSERFSAFLGNLLIEEGFQQADVSDRSLYDIWSRRVSAFYDGGSGS